MSLGRGGKGAFDCQNCAFKGNKANNGLVGTTSIQRMLSFYRVSSVHSGL